MKSGLEVRGLVNTTASAAYQMRLIKEMRDITAKYINTKKITQ